MSRALGLTEDQLHGELYVAWLKDVRERPSPQALKRFRDIVERGMKDRDVVFRRQRLGVNVAITLSSLLAGSSLMKLDLYENVLRDTGCEAVSHLLRETPNLTYLNLGGNDIGSTGIQMLSSVIATHKRLQVLILGSADGDTHINRIDSTCAKILVEALSKSRSIKVLDLSRNPIGRGSQEAFPLIAALLQGSTVLQVLKLAGTEMQPESGLTIAQAVGRCPSLNVIDLHDNYLSHHTADAFGKLLTERAARAAPHSLKHILLNGNPALGERGAPALFKPLSLDRSVTHINVAGCNVTNEGLLVLCSSLITNTALLSIDLRNNHLTEDGCVEFARAIVKHPALTELHLGGNKLKDDGACALASILESNTILQSLDLSSAGIGDRGVIALGVALSSNKSLHTLQLSDNHISEEGGTAFAALLEKNRTLQHCNLKGNSMFHCTLLAAMKIVNRNMQLKQDEVPSKLRKEVVQLHYQLYKLEEAKNELAVQQANKQEADRKQEHYEAMFRTQETQYRDEKKSLSDQLKHMEESCKDLESQIAAIAENFKKYCSSHEGDIAILKERLALETKEREAVDEELRALQLELNNAGVIKEKKIELLKQRIAETKEERQRWIEQTKELRNQNEVAQQRLKELENLQSAALAEQVASAAAKQTKDDGKKSKKAKGKDEINALLGDA
jgi:Ran GTPase-activating protein (RanGAP) involved in mRNA processing and transport